jgi:NADH:ubiquinone oxidoreductase subunit
MGKKVCFKCLVEKNLTEFYKHSEMKDGYLNKCKECCIKESKKNRSDNLEYYTLYEKKRNQLPHRVEARKKYQKENPEKVKFLKREWNKKNRHKRNAHLKVKMAIIKGILSRPEACSSCGQEGIIEAHHEDYSKPLEVKWLCKKCHTKEHHG